ncbi:MAG: hypothetical protein JSW21_00435 [Gammaproteobacteria bacterium]|nr:MAG: hypothetical protein JSW21_00435 [Gammaproteobacteria bacterium]
MRDTPGLSTMIALTLALAACSSLPTSSATKDLQVAPAYTQEEKDAMTEEEKVAAYNESMSQDRDEIVCRRVQVTGSHFKQTVCKTRAEMEQERQDAQDAIMRARGNTGDPYAN